jgi:hypothetical protein
LALGSEAFVSEMHRLQSQLQQGKRVTGVQVYGRRPKGLSRTVILEVVAETFDRPTSDFFHQKHSSPLRPTLAYLLYRFGAMTQQEIADTIGVKSSAAVSLQIKRLLAARKTAKDLDETLTDLENRLAHL